MEDPDEPILTVSERRERIQRKLTENGGTIRPAPKRPPVPPHNHKPPRFPEASTSAPPRTTSHRKFSHGERSGVFPSEKPPLPPKPKQLLEKGTVPITPIIRLNSEQEERDSGDDRTKEDTDKRDSKNSSSNSEDHRTTSPESVRERAKAFDKPFGVFAPRPESTISSISMTSRDTEFETRTLDMGSFSDSDSETERQENLGLLHRRLGLEEMINKISDRRPSSVSVVSTDQSMHEKIVDELIGRGLLRESRRTVKSEIPLDVGRMRDEKKTRSLTVSVISDDGSSRGDSMISERSSTATLGSGDADVSDGVKDYQTGDLDEDKRLKKLHYAALEFYTVQSKFVKYLDEMGNVYPNYVAEYGKRLGKDLLAHGQNGQPHVVLRLQNFMLQILTFHKELLREIANKISNWDSVNPTMAVLILKYADFLKVCKPFLIEKATLLTELTELRRDSHDFNSATTSFEEKMFCRGVGAVTQQLDQVHQNFMRYKILMMSYDNYLLEDSKEKETTRVTIERLEKVTQSVNESLGMPTNQELIRLYYRFQGQFNVFTPGRRVIRQGEVYKQSRREPQSRYLVLFSDILWICREAGLGGSAGFFDMTRSYDIPLEMVTTQAAVHEDYENQLWIVSQKKSFLLIMKSLGEREAWERDIRSARDERKRAVRRISQATIRQRRRSVDPTVNGLHKISGVSEREENGDSADSESENSEKEESADEQAGNIKDLLQKGRVQAPWIPDEASSKCLMDGCDTIFGILHRRHHCRDCGWLICSNCIGRAPIAKLKYRKENVCPECYERIEAQYMNGTLFPESVLVRCANDEIRIAIEKGNGKQKSRITYHEPQTLFAPPLNRRLKRMDVDARMKQSDNLVFGKVFLRVSRAKEMMRHAQLTDGMILKFYKAVFDDEPIEQYIIYGFQLDEKFPDDCEGCVFELRHQNQIQTDRREDFVSFRVEAPKSIQKWSAALRNGLGLNNNDLDTGESTI